MRKEREMGKEREKDRKVETRKAENINENRKVETIEA
jgi:hypothetical protein